MTVYANHEWIGFYEAAALETDVTILPKKIEAAEHAISQRVMATQIDDSERQAMFMALCALMALWETQLRQPMCSQSRDQSNIVSPLNGRCSGQAGVGGSGQSSISI